MIIITTHPVFRPVLIFRKKVRLIRVIIIFHYYPQHDLTRRTRAGFRHGWDLPLHQGTFTGQRTCVFVLVVSHS